MDKQTFYAKAVKVSFSLNVKDEKGKPMWKQNPITGALLIQDGKPVPEQRMIQFDTISENPKLGYLCSYATDDKEEISRLEELCKNSGSGVMCEEDYKRTKNPEAYQREQEKKKVEAEVVELKARVAKAEEKTGKASAMEAEIARLNKELEAARGSGGNKSSGR